MVQRQPGWSEIFCNASCKWRKQNLRCQHWGVGAGALLAPSLRDGDSGAPVVWPARYFIALRCTLLMSLIWRSLVQETLRRHPSAVREQSRPRLPADHGGIVGFCSYYDQIYCITNLCYWLWDGVFECRRLPWSRNRGGLAQRGDFCGDYVEVNSSIRPASIMGEGFKFLWVLTVPTPRALAYYSILDSSCRPRADAVWNFAAL